MPDEIVTEFLTEATEFPDELERDLLMVDEGRDLVRVIAETFHTFKGTASFLGFTDELQILGFDFSGAEG